MTAPVDRVRWNTDPEYRERLRRHRRASHVNQVKTGWRKAYRQQPAVKAKRQAEKAKWQSGPGRARWNAYTLTRHHAPLAKSVRKAMNTDPAVKAATRAVRRARRPAPVASVN